MSKIILFSLLVFSGMFLGVIVNEYAPENKEIQGVEWFETPREIDNFSLSSIEGQFNNQSFDKKWSIVMFGFLSCNHVCPVGLKHLADISREFNKADLRSQVEMIFVSVDSYRDSNEEVSDHLKHFEPSIRGVTGNEEQLKILTKSLGIRFATFFSEKRDRVTHSNTFSIIGPNGNLRGRIRLENTPSTVVESFKKLFKSFDGHSFKNKNQEE